MNDRALVEITGAALAGKTLPLNSLPPNMAATSLLRLSGSNLHVKHIGRCPIRISLFYYDTTYLLSTDVHIPIE